MDALDLAFETEISPEGHHRRDDLPNRLYQPQDCHGHDRALRAHPETERDLHPLSKGEGEQGPQEAPHWRR